LRLKSTHDTSKSRNGIIDIQTLGFTKEEYTQEQFMLDFPEKLVKCQYCNKKFVTQFDSKFCSDNCFIRKKTHGKVNKRKHYVKSGRRT